MRRSDGSYHVGKFQNNFQNRRVLVNELLATILAVRLGLPTTPIAIVDVREQLIRLTPDAYIEMHHTRIPCQPGLQFGSRYLTDPHRVTLLDFLPHKQVLRARILEVAKTLPPEWYEFDSNSLRRLLERLDHRRKVVSQLLRSAWKSSPQVFPKWSEQIGTEEETNHVTQTKSSIAVNCCTECLAREPSY